MNYIDSDMVADYISNEIDYIKQDMAISGFSDDLMADLLHLESFTTSDIEEINNKVNDDEELRDKINELIHYYIYH